MPKEKLITKHIPKEGSRLHVSFWDSNGKHCSEPSCKINHSMKVRRICPKKN